MRSRSSTARQILQQVGLPAHDQALALVRGAGPLGQARVDDLLRQLVEFGLGVLQALFDRRARFGQRQAANVGVEIVRGFLQGRRRQCRAGAE